MDDLTDLLGDILDFALGMTVGALDEHVGKAVEVPGPIPFSFHGLWEDHTSLLGAYSCGDHAFVGGLSLLDQVQILARVGTEQVSGTDRGG